MSQGQFIGLSPQKLSKAVGKPPVFEWMADGLPVQCAWCDGDGDACNPGNADAAVKVTDWLYPVICPRCGGTGKDPNP